MKILINALLLVVIVCFWSCQDDYCHDFDEYVINKMERENEITKDEYSQIKKYIKNHKYVIKKHGCANGVFQDGKVSDKEIHTYLTETKNKRRNSKDIEIYDPTETNFSPSDNLNINVFIENSLSIDGYVKGNTYFNHVLGNFVITIKQLPIYNKTPIELNFINTKVRNTKRENDELVNILNSLEPNKAPYRVKNDGVIENTKIENIVTKVIKQTNDTSLSILVSDFIYSPPKGGNETMYKASQKLYNQFGNILSNNEHFAVLILQFQSKFKNALYYSVENNDEFRIKQQRPYYIWLFGNYNRVSNLYNNSNFKLNDFKGYLNSFFIHNKSILKPKFTILKTSTNKKSVGKITLDRDNKGHGISSLKPSERKKPEGKLEFFIAMNIDNLLVNKGYIKDPSNYKASSPFKVKKIEKLPESDITSLDRKRIKDWATHVISLRCKGCGNLNDLDKIQLKLERNAPDWIYNSTTTDDTDEEKIKDKTFGFSKLIDGILKAYELNRKNNDHYFKVKISVNNE